MKISPNTSKTPTKENQDPVAKGLMSHIQTLQKNAEKALSPLTQHTKDLRAIAARASQVGKEGAFISLIFASAVYPVSTVAAVQRIQGVSVGSAVRELAKGGLLRFYTGALPSAAGLMMMRFCDAAGDMAASEALSRHAPQHKTPANCAIIGALVAGTLYLPLMPMETLAVTARTSGKAGVQKLASLVTKQGIAPLYNGALESITEGFVDHLVWYGARHCLEEVIPKAIGARDEFLRNCLIGAISGLASDSISYPINIVKTQKQVFQSPKPAIEIGREIVQQHGVGELWRRGFPLATTSHSLSDAGFQAVMAARGNTDSHT